MRPRAVALSHEAKPADTAAPWRGAVGVMLAAILALLGLYRATFLSMVDIWRRSDTFAHGFLILPISAWLIWRRRHEVARIVPRPDYRALPVFAVLGLGWFVARVSGVLAVEQLALVGMIPVTVWMLLGWRVLAELMFPLGFLGFAVPLGEFLIPAMMEFTAGFTVGMLRITGIPVFREGLWFSIPSGDWSVAEECSGLRYLMASTALGCLYAYLNYRALSRRLAFMVLAVAFPVLANGLRAYLIVMIAHLSDMKLAVGVDHFIYGWVFFGGVMLGLFWFGARWAEQERSCPAAVQADPLAAVSAGGMAALGKGLAVVLALAALWPARAAYIEHQAAARATPPVSVALPDTAGAWRAIAPWNDWAPSYAGPEATAAKSYGDGARRVAVYLLYYRHQKQGAELINSRNRLVTRHHPVWKVVEEKPVETVLNGKPATVLQGYLHSTAQELVTWRWNRVGGAYTANAYAGKWLEAKQALLGRNEGGTAMIVAADYADTENPASAVAVLRRFLAAWLPLVEHRLSQAAENAGITRP